jgi:ribonucleoside-diphosphate reductase subunit M2
MGAVVDVSESKNKYSFLPIEFPLLESYYQRQKQTVWVPAEIDFTTDRSDWDRLDEDTQNYIKHLLFLFAQLDGIVNENLVENFKEETSFCKEARFFYAVQEYIEVIHNETYSLLIQTFIRNDQERLRGLDSISHYPAIKAIAEWCFKWMKRDIPLPQRIVAFACVEGVIFSSAFAGIYWIKKKNVLKGLTKANEWIARDEALHTEFAVALYHVICGQMKKYPELSQEQIITILTDAVSVTEQFTRTAMNVHLVGLDADQMMRYVKCTADRLATSLGYNKIYNEANPFEWMLVIGLPNKTNFFEDKVSEYATAKNNQTVFDLDAFF